MKQVVDQLPIPFSFFHLILFIKLVGPMVIGAVVIEKRVEEIFEKEGVTDSKVFGLDEGKPIREKLYHVFCHLLTLLLILLCNIDYQGKCCVCTNASWYFHNSLFLVLIVFSFCN